MPKRKPIGHRLVVRVAMRDQGICAACKIDTRKLQDDISTSWSNKPAGVVSSSEQIGWCKTFLLRGFKGQDFNRYKTRLWDIDHIMPLALGGTNDLSNLRTLCIPCHRHRSLGMPLPGHHIAWTHMEKLLAVAYSPMPPDATLHEWF